MLGLVIRRLIWLMLLYVTPVFVCAQQPSVTVRGSVASANDGELIAGATVLLLSRSDSSFIDYGITDESGAFEFKAERRPSEGWLLKVRSIGYAATFFPVSTITEGILVELKPVGEQLQEIIVSEKAPVRTVGKDTILYRGEAFRDSTERKVSELLNKLPGVEVNEVGDVKVNGQAIRTVLIDGDNLLDNNYQVLTNNLDANVVENIEIIYNYLDNPLLATVFEGADIAVNLLTAEGKRRKLNLSFFAGGGTSKRYKLETNAIGLYDRLKSITFLSQNNLGDPAPRLSSNPLPVADFALQSLLQPGQERLDRVTVSGTPDPTRLNSVGLLSSIAHLTLGKNWRLRASIVAPTDNYELRNTTFFDYSGDDSDERVTQQTNGDATISNYSMSLRKEVPGRARYEIKGTLLDTKQEQNTDFGGGETYGNRGRYRGVGLRGIIIQKFGRHTLGFFDVVYQNAGETMDHALTDPVRGVLTWPDGERRDSLRQRQVYQPRTTYFSGKLLSRIGKSRVIITSGFNHGIGRFNFSGPTGDLERLNRKELFLSGRFQYHLSNTVKVRTTVRGGSIAVVGLGEVDAHLPYLTFSAALEKEWNIMKYLRASYLHGRSVPEELRAVSTPRYRSRYLITEGDPQVQNDLNTSQKFSVEFATGNVLPHRSFTLRATADRGEQGYLPDYRVVGNTTIASWTIGERSRDAYSVGARGEYFVGLFSSTIKLNGDYRQDRYQTLLAADLNDVKTTTLNWSLALKTGINIPVNFALGVEQVHTRLQPENAINYTSVQTLPYVDLILVGGGKLSARWSNNWQLLKAGRETSRNLIADAEFGYRLSGKLSRLGLRFYNIFNSKSISNSRVYDFGQITRSSAIRARYVLVSVEVKW